MAETASSIRVRSSDEIEPSDSYLITFTSLSVMLLSFFVYLNALAVPDTKRERRVVRSVNTEFRPSLSEAILGQPQRSKARRDMPIPELGLGFTGLTLGNSSGAPTDLPDSAKLGVVRRLDRTVITIPGENLFLSGEATIKADFLPVLDQLAERVLEYDLALEIVGHTDDRPIQSARYHSNWDLSVARAVSVLRYFMDRGVPRDHLVASGKAQYRPVAPNDTEQGRAKNRRVEIIVKQPIEEP